MQDENNGAGFRVTLGTVYTQLGELSARVGDLATNQKLMAADLNRMATDNAELKKTLADQELRHSTELEKVRSRVNGVLIGVGSGMIIGIPALIGLLR